MKRSTRWAAAILLAGCADEAGSPAVSTDTTGDPSEIMGSAATDPSTTSGPTGTATAAADTSSAEDTSTGEPPIQPGPDEVIELFAGTHVYFLGDDDKRHVDVQVELPPPDLAYASVRLGIVLTCPNDLCDWWDRLGHIAIVHDAGTDHETVTELARFITPYRVGATWILDVSHLRPVLAGPVTVRVFIDTWVGPGHVNGEGWLVDASLELIGGIPERIPMAVLPLWRDHSVEYGNPGAPVAETAPPTTATIPADATSVELVSIITGHGQGNLDNCAEFCPRVHGFTVGEAVIAREVWRDDCQDTPVQGQQGTWTLPRAGWCPGAEVLPWIEDVTASATPGREVAVAYDIEDYVNTCAPRSPECMGCALGTGCEYDGGNHTVPRYQLSAWLVAYRDPPP